MIAPQHLMALTNLAGPGGATQDADIIAPHITEWRDKFKGQTPLMLMPADAKAVSRIMRYCQSHKIAIVPQGGNTGLVGGGIPGLEGRDEILLSTKRMTKILAIDTADNSITTEAGVTIQALQDAARDADRLFPLSLASEGSCTAGGVIATNAGGIHVVRYGTVRSLTLGIEAVLPSGDIINSLSALRKDNTGYNLSQLLVGAEGTLGIVTKACFRLAAPERQKHTAWLAVATPTDALSLLASLRDAMGDRVSAFEFLPAVGLAMVLRHIPGTRDPLGSGYPWYVLTDIAASQIDTGLASAFEDWLAQNMESGLILDGAIAASESQAQAFWKLRESMSEAQKLEGGSIKHDIAVPVARVPDFLTLATARVEGAYPGSRAVPFGHLGDGNIHFNIMQPAGADKTSFLAHWAPMNEMVHDIVCQLGGSISAEHGIGTLKRDELARLKPGAELAAMRAIKAALDPNHILNPGVLFS